VTRRAFVEGAVARPSLKTHSRESFFIVPRYGATLYPSENVPKGDDMGSSTQKEDALLSAASRLDDALELRDTKQFLTVLSQTIRTQGGYTAAARGTGISRTSLYKIVSPAGNPTADTLFSILAHLGLRLTVQPLDNDGVRLASALKRDVH
jgi:probable addiction module antidote protein